MNVGAFSSLTSFQQRVISSCVIVPVFLLAIYFGGVLYFLLMGFILATSFNEWMEMAEKSTSRNKLSFIGSVYLALGLGAFFVLRLLPVEQVIFITLALMVMIWACDTGAYFSGKLIGGKKLCPTISPGKTWAGLIGGLTASGLVAVLFHNYWGFYGSITMAFVLGVVIGGAGQIGDLVISFLKRKVGVKDTGTLIPGHGGVLDRVDSLILAAPVYLMFLYFITDVSTITVIK